MNRAGIVGLGLWVPETVRENDAWSPAFVRAFHEQREARRARDFTTIGRSAPDRPYDELFARHAAPHEDDPFKGTTRRRVMPPGALAAEGDAIAARAAIADAGVEPRDVDLVLSSAIVQDALCPSNGPAIQDLVGCVRAPGIGVEGYCSSALAQLDLAAGLVESARANFVLCVQSHQISRINDLDLPTSPIFGDGSAAFVVGAVTTGRGLQRVVRGGDGSLRGAVTHVHKQTPNAHWWLDAAGPVVPGSGDPDSARRFTKNILAYPIDTLRELCTAAEIRPDSIDVLSMIQPVAWYQAAVADGLGIPASRVPTTHGEYAHLGGAAIVANLLEARRQGLLREGASVALYAHGSGMTRYAALLRWQAAR